MVPYALDSNDMKFFHPNGFMRASDMTDPVIDMMDGFEAHARRCHTRLLNTGFHLGITSRPGRLKAFEASLAERAARQDRVWVATRSEIARAGSTPT